MKKAGRPRAQLGYVYEKSGSWIGRYRQYRGTKPEQVSLKLGRTAELTEGQARAKMKSIIDAETEKLPLFQRVGRKGMLKLKADNPFPSRKAFMPGARGAAAELMVCADLLSKGMEVFRGVSPQAACDLVIFDELRRFLRVEVKSVSENKRGIVNCNVGRNIGNFDLIAFVFEDGRILYREPDEIHSERYPLGAKRSSDSAHHIAQPSQEIQ